MKKRTRNFLIIILSIISIIALALIDILDKGTLTYGFLGTIVLLASLLIIPAIQELVKENKRK